MKNDFEKVAITLVPRRQVMYLDQGCLHIKCANTKNSRKASCRKNRRLVGRLLVWNVVKT